MNHFSEDFLQLPLHDWWPPLAVTMVERYFPLLKAKFHKKLDPHIERLLTYFRETSMCLECGTYWETPKWDGGEL
jgi:hypothetical protein